MAQKRPFYPADDPDLPPPPEGYRDAIFVRPITDFLRCIFCQSVMKDAVVLGCECSPSACKECAEAWFLRNKGEKICPQGRHPIIMVAPNRPIRQLVQDLLVRCFHHREGCHWEGRLEELEGSHITRECPKAPVSCPYNPETCPAQGKLLRQDLETHRLACPNAPVDCPHCKIPFARRLMESHLAACPTAPAGCPQCGSKTLTRATIEKHMQDECPKGLVACPVPHCPMSGHVTREALAVHMVEGVCVHIDALIRQNEELRGAVAALKTAAEGLISRNTALEQQNTQLTAQMAALTARMDAFEARNPPPPPRPVLTDEAVVWDPDCKEATLVLSEGNRTISSTVGAHQSALGTVGWSAGIHRWRVRVISGPHWVGLGVHPKPRGGGADYTTAYGSSHIAQLYQGKYVGDSGIRYGVGDVVACVLDCASHVLTMNVNGNEPTLTIADIPQGTYYPWVNLHSAVSVTAI